MDGSSDIRQSLEAIARRVGIDLEVEAEIIEDRREGGGDHDGRVGNFKERGHHEGRGTHDRRHEHAAGRGAGLDAAGIGRPKPTRFMAGMVMTPVVRTLVITLPDMEPMRPDEKIATLAGPPRWFAQERKGEVEEERTAARVLQRNAEDQEADDEVGERIHRNAENAF